MPKEKGFAEYTDGKFDVAKTYGVGYQRGRHGLSGRAMSRAATTSWLRLTEGTDYEIVKDERRRTLVRRLGALVHEMQPLFFQPGKSDWNTFELIRAFGNRGEKVPGLNANTDGVSSIGSDRNAEANLFQIRKGYDPEVATIQWEMLSNAEFSVAIPLYSALLTEVSPYFSDQDRLLTITANEDGRREQRGAQELHQLRPHGHQHALPIENRAQLRHRRPRLSRRPAEGAH